MKPSNQHLRKVAFITGASRGIGAATAAALARLGIEPVLAVRDMAAAEPVADAVRGQGMAGLVVPCDVGEAESIRSAVASCLDAFGRIDIVVNNAALIEPIGHIADVDAQAWSRALTVNVAGPFHLLQATLPSLIERGGVVINLSTGAAHRPREGWSAYCTTKAGLAMLTRCVAHEYETQGVAAYGVIPGLVDTSMQTSIRASGMNEISRLPKEQLKSPDHAARLIAWLASARPDDLRGREVDIHDEQIRSRAGIEHY